MRSEHPHLTTILEAADAVTILVATHCRESFQGDEHVRTAVLRELARIGAAATHLQAPFRDAHPEVDWDRLASLRHFGTDPRAITDWFAVWDAATTALPAASQEIATLLERSLGMDSH